MAVERNPPNRRPLEERLRDRDFSKHRRPGDPRRRLGRIRLRAARGRARYVRRPGREGQAGRHLPAPRLHPHQGAAARRRGRRRCSGGRSVRREDRARGHRHGRRQQVQGRRRRQDVQGPAGPGEVPQGSATSRAPARSSRPTPSTSTAQRYTGTQRRAGHRLLRRSPCPAWRSAAGSSPATRR